MKKLIRELIRIDRTYNPYDTFIDKDGYLCNKRGRRFHRVSFYLLNQGFTFSPGFAQK